MTADLFTRLRQYYGAEPDRRGEVHVACPWCGKEAIGGQTHFSFSKSGGAHCFVCGNGGSLQTLAREIGLDTGDDDWSPPKREPRPLRPRKRYWWQDHPDATLRRIIYLPIDERLRLWQKYRPQITRQMVEEHRLGYGKLPPMIDYRNGGYRPASKCQHDRLLVPLFDFDGQLVGVRGRSIDCDCGKWLSPAGNQATLYGWQALHSGATVVLCENAIDALLVTELTDAVGVATLSISYWRDEWLEYLVASEPVQVIIAFDNHWPGNGTRKAEWLRDHRVCPMPMGMKRFNDFQRAGLDVRMYPWQADDPVGCDVGDVLAG